MKKLVFDSGAVITLAMNDLLWALIKLKKLSGVEFYIADSVREELVDRPMESRKFKLEAIMIRGLINAGIFKVHERIDVYDFLNRVNSIFRCGGENFRILQKGEVESVVLAVRLKADALVVDERTMRLVVENPSGLERFLENKFHREVSVDKKLLDEFGRSVKGLKIIRTTELMLVALEKGIFNNTLKGVSKREFVDGLLWGLRLRGCAISTDEINELLRRYR